ncbi:MAG: SDR family oxidoreductase [Spirochaetales bacterium]|nr:SDR family oxidoreductase [Spirochaetales bacterium]
MGSRMKGKVAIVTGGSSGIGAATAQMFAQQGARVMIAARGKDAGEALVKKLKGRAAFCRTDVTVEADIKAMVEATVSRWGRVDCLVNNACSSVPRVPIEEYSAEYFSSQIMLVLGSVFICMKYVVPIMKKQRSGSIINIASTAGMTHDGSSALYGAGKAALIHVSKIWALEVAEHGIRVNCISPGGIMTPIFLGGHDKHDEAENKELLDKLAAFYVKSTPVGRAGWPEDIAHAALFLGSDESTYVTGQNLAVEGGRHTLGRSFAEYRERFAERSRVLQP